MKRFYKATSAVEVADAWHVHLDARAVKTPGKAALALPSQALAAAIAEEWAAQGEEVVPDTMPLTQYACSAIDRVAPARTSVITQASAYGETDLLAYPTDEPADLRAKQDDSWLPLIARLEALGWTLQQTSGLMAIDQDPDLRPRAQAWLERQDDMRLTALASLIETSGSFFLAYLLAEDGLGIDSLIEACTIEERFNLEAWGSDEEAEQLLARRKADLRSAAQMLDLL